MTSASAAQPKGGAAAAARAHSSDPDARTAEVPFVSRTPDLGARKERVIRIFALFTLTYGFAFLTWRWAATLNPDALWISVPLVLAESLVLLTTALLVFNVWRLRRRTPLPAPDGLAVDVFITTYDEPLEVIRKTALGARAIRYPHETYILDDGRRFEVRALARELDIGYLTRPDNRHAKAGNLNSALRHTSGEFILQLDADHAPLPFMLDRLLGYFDDPRVAFVQSPQNFYNTDSFSSHVQRENNRLYTDQAVFFSVIQPGKDTREAAFFCGSCGVLRRSAFDQLGGFSTETITEDIETSMRLHALGWRSVYHNEPLAYGLAPRTSTAFHIQRLRWGQGGMQMLRKLNPLTYPGLSPSQRICYVSSALHPLDGVLRLIFIATPLLFLLTGALPIRTLDVEFFTRFVPYIGCMMLLHHLLSRGTGGPLWYIEYSSMAKFFTHVLSTFAALTRKRLRFRVTPKGVNGVSWVSYAPQVMLMVVTACAVGWGTFAYRTGRIAYGPSESGSLPFLLNVAWVAWNFAMALLVVRASVLSHQRRPDHRFEDLMPARFSVEPSSRFGERIGVTDNLNGRGLGFRATDPVSVGTRVRFKLPLTTGTVDVVGSVVHQRRTRAGRLDVYVHGVVLDALPQSTADAIELHCTQHAVTVTRSRYVEWADPFREAWHALRDPRRGERQSVRLPLEIAASDEDADVRLAVLEETSRRGACFLLDRPVEQGHTIAFRVPGTDLRGQARIAYCHELHTAFGSRFRAGARQIEGTATKSLFTIPRESKMKKVAMLAGLITAARRFSVILTVAAAGLTLSAPLVGQLTQGVLTGAERDSDGQNLLLVGGWIGGSGGAWRPVAGVIGYRLEAPIEGGSTVAWAANPFLGVRRQWSNGGVQANVGYAFRQTEGDVVDAQPRERVSSGLTTGLQVDHGTSGPFGAQAIAHYSWDDDGYLWSRLRANARVVRSQGGSELRAGAEATAQGDDVYRAYEVGPVLEWRAMPGLAIVAGGGLRRAEVRGQGAQNLSYLRIEMVLVR